MTDASDDDPLALAARAGLPDDLRFLLGDYPRRIWGEHPNFGPQTKFYLDRHAMFREAMEVMRRLTQEGLDEAHPRESYGRDFARIAQFFLRELSTHHQVEDHHYFPMLVRAEPRLTRGFWILDRDHHAIHDALDRFAQRANDGLRALGAASGDAKTPLGSLERELASLEKLLHRHLWDEEELVIPVMLDKGEENLA